MNPYKKRDEGGEGEKSSILTWHNYSFMATLIWSLPFDFAGFQLRGLPYRLEVCYEWIIYKKWQAEQAYITGPASLYGDIVRRFSVFTETQMTVWNREFEMLKCSTTTFLSRNGIQNDLSHKSPQSGLPRSVESADEKSMRENTKRWDPTRTNEKQPQVNKIDPSETNGSLKQKVPPGNEPDTH